MEAKPLSESTVKYIRYTAVICGALLIIIAIFANSSGLSLSNGISRNQILFAAGGLLLAGAGISGRKFPGIYRGTGVILLNILAALLILELVSIAAVKIICGGELSLRQRKIEEGHLDVAERMTVNGLYAPFVVWRSNPLMNSDSVTVDQSGYRNTPGNSEDPESVTVMLLGGSSMWGTGVSDRNTIPTHLLQILEERAAVPVRVVNLGQVAYSSTQEVIELMLQLRNGSRPDIVIFYDGFNDVWGAYEAGYAGSHHSEGIIADLLDGTSLQSDLNNPYKDILSRTNTFLMINTLRRRFAPETESYLSLQTYRTMGISSDTLARSIADTYLANMDIVLALSEHYGFKCLFVIQPAIWFSEKELTEYEREVLAGGSGFFLAGEDPAFSDLFTETYNLFISEAVLREDLVSYTDIFNTIEESVYIDYSGVHVFGWANCIVAESLYAEITRIEPALFTGRTGN